MVLKSVKTESIESIKKHQIAFGLELSDAAVESLADYYELIQEHNPVLHLVAPCSAEEFAIRHILESLTLLEYLPENSRFATSVPAQVFPRFHVCWFAMT
jgi:Predicted S-adenosylmethionine-dependent methyltransferase involved in bacterial cell division